MDLNPWELEFDRDWPDLDSLPLGDDCYNLKDRLMDLILGEREEFLRNQTEDKPLEPLSDDQPQSLPPEKPSKPQRPWLKPQQRVECDVQKLIRSLHELMERISAIESSATREEDPNISRRRIKDFHTRTKRQMYALSKQVSTVNSTNLRVDLNPMDKRLQTKADVSLHQVLQAALTIINSCVAQLAFSRPNLVLQPLLDGMGIWKKLTQACSNLGYPVLELVEKLQEVDHCIRPKPQVPVLSPLKEPPKITSKLSLVNNLAHERFGPKSPKKTNEKMFLAASKDTSPPTNLGITSAEPLREKLRYHKTHLDLREIEIAEIKKARINQKPVEFFAHTPYDQLALVFNPVQLVQELSKEITNDIIFQVCQEMSQDQLIQKLITEELK